MTTNTAPTTSAAKHVAGIESARLAADAAVDAELDRHATDYARLWPEMPRTADGEIDLSVEWPARVVACKCGWEPGTYVADKNRTRALGLHLSATAKAAGKLWEPAYDAALAAAKSA